MAYYKEIRIPAEGNGAVLYVTDDAVSAEALRGEGKAVLIYLHPGNAGQDFSRFLFAAEDPEDLEEEYVRRVYRRLKGLPWEIAETDRCRIRETTPEDVEEFYRIYSDPAITRYMDGLYPDVEQEKQYIREYIEKVYTFYGFGVWTVVEKESGAVIGRAGLSYREGFDDPELGFIIGVPWQGRGYARRCWTMPGLPWNLTVYRLWWSREIRLLCGSAKSWGFDRREKQRCRGRNTAFSSCSAESVEFGLCV